MKNVMFTCSDVILKVPWPPKCNAYHNCLGDEVQFTKQSVIDLGLQNSMDTRKTQHNAGQLQHFF